MLEFIVPFTDKVAAEKFDRCHGTNGELVRCKDCMYWKSDMLTHFWKPCDVVNTDKDWYCPCGNRG